MGLALRVLVLLMLTAGTAAAQGSFFNSSPGALSTSHASIDGPDNCNLCHDGGRETNNQKCLDCHDHSDLKGRIARGEGFHGRSPLVKGKPCESCHFEHKGRGFDLMGWRAVPGGEKGFDHDITGWKLQGKHSAIDCADCHKTRNKQGLRTYLGEDKLCGSCHKADQPHGFERREMLKCERCHGESVWNPPKPPHTQDFDHNDKDDALMPLVGSHEDVSCAKCHPKALFNLKGGNPDFCGNCHDSPHDDHLFGKKECEWCHSPSYGALDKFKFNHDARTSFDLGTSHNKMKCYDCHTKSLGEAKPDKTCEASGCHAKDNKHGDRFNAFGGDPPSCVTCHLSSADWKRGATSFNHDKKTKFTLTGRHDEIGCRNCHRGKNAADFERFDPKDVGCRGCHQHKNVHPKEKFKDSECLGCHKGAGKLELTAKSVDVYHGPRSRFPLVKAHKFVKCGQCHPKDQFKDTPIECGVRCHEDSLHKGTLGDECTPCHSPGIWDAVRFDHTDDTKWPLEGLHAKIADCADCHPKRAYDGTPTTCSAAGCHAKDDVHKARLGSACDRCHKTDGDNIFNHNTMSRFALDGQHLTTRCSDCHPSVTFKPRPTNCFGCHPEPAVHLGQYGTVCETCHTTVSFTDIKPLHDVGDFSLTGSHDNLACARCHKDSRPMAGTGNLCINCHRQDDIHQNSLSPRCGECHTQWAFAPARFDHTTVGCNLTGLHRTLACNDCHVAGNYGAITAECVGCHRDEAARKGGPHLGYTTCTGSGCHNPNSWAPQIGYGRESICR